MNDRVLDPLNRHHLRSSGHRDDALEVSFDLPERVVQFGTGAFLRGFAEYFVARANQAGRLNGRVVMVGSTGSGRARRLDEQDGLYTLLVRGREDGAVVDRAQIVAAVSRALASQDQWDDVLACAHNPDLALIISNTTEVGITLEADDRIDLDPPRSYPGKLTAFLYERARAFGYDPDKGLIILPCELIEGNGDTLRGIVRRLAECWDLGADFLRWLDEANRFCNTLVDRIVPGTPDGDELDALWHRLGYHDDLLTVAEPYRLWAIEGDEELARRLPLAGADPGIVIAEDITPFRVRKVRILNGAHTIMVPTALQCGCKTVREAVEHPLLSRFVRRVVYKEIVPSLDSEPEQARAFAQEVLERFANPFIEHELLSITFQQTAKLKVRVVPSLVGFTARHDKLPPLLTFGFAGFLLYQHPGHRTATGSAPGDDAADAWASRWQGVDLEDTDQVRRLVEDTCSDAEQWGRRLDALPGFTEAVSTHLIGMIREGVPAALEAHLQAVERGEEASI